MQFWKTTFLVIVVVWSVLSTGRLQASPDEKMTPKSNNDLELQKPNKGRSIDDIGGSRAADQEPLIVDQHRSRKKRAAATAAEQNEILRLHNLFRQKEGASDMYYMRWNGLLASMAATWASACNFVHGQPSATGSILGYQRIGQNLYAGGRLPINWTFVVQNWFSEKLNYNYKNNSCAPGKNCAHYKQVVWSTTYEIGCGYTICPVLPPTSLVKAVYVVCNYGPGGNNPSLKPYQVGALCSNCSSGQFYCNKGLCDKTCTSSGPNCACSAACRHCGNVTNNCRCKCTVGWSGNDCSKQCKNTDARCGASPGWPALWCSSYAFVRDSCPLMCKQCVAGIPPPCVITAPRPRFVAIHQQESAWEVSPGLGTVNPPATSCLCVRSANISVQSKPSPEASVLRMANTGDCFLFQEVVLINWGGIWHKVNAAPGEMTVDGWIDGQYLTQPWCPASNGATCNNPNQRFDNGLATCCLEAERIWSVSKGGCTDPSRAMCTSLSNTRCKCLEELILFRRDSQAGTRIVEGTEVGGDRNHTEGYMLSLESNKAIINYVTSRFEPAGVRARDGIRQWKSPRGNTWIWGALVWDVYCP